MNTIEAVVKNGYIVPLGSVRLEEGEKVLVTLSNSYDEDFWIAAGESTLDEIWDNEEDDVYAELLGK
ncbi:MAG: antitoxin family protein [Pyrinomonadaceae bacterium]